MNMLVMSSDFCKTFYNYCLESGDGYFLVITTFTFTWPRSNSLFPICDNLDKTVPTYANFQDGANYLNSSSVISLITWLIILLPTWIGTHLW